MTPLEITASKLASSNGSASIRDSTSSTCGKPRARAAPALASWASVMSTPTTRPRLADQHGGAEDVGARARAEVEHGLARLQRREVEVVADAGEGGERLGRDGVQQLGLVAEVLGQAAPDLEVQLGVAAGDVAVHVLDGRLEPLAVHQRARVELGQRLRLCHLVHETTVTPGGRRLKGLRKVSGRTPKSLRSSAPSWIRTSGLLLRRESLYPAELSGPARGHLNPRANGQSEASGGYAGRRIALAGPWQGTPM